MKSITILLFLLCSLFFLNCSADKTDQPPPEPQTKHIGANPPSPNSPNSQDLEPDLHISGAPNTHVSGASSTHISGGE
ncbi:MAG: hypothetical protein COW89_10445 [Nitrospinae bacterium CG22_combo_CG10-13_8_21_14_all_47_10]|nr:MAG: hypothetical protein COW89_10445 [Nitrospinae bacterium CG22_combo_CG10-13_8_21_14_all_47_10]